MHYPLTLLRRLVGLGGGLASLELLKVPVADLHVAVVLVHALRELLRGAGAVVTPLLVLSLGVVVLFGGLAVVLLGSRLGRGAAGEEASDGVANRRTDSDTAVTMISLSSKNRHQLRRGLTQR